MFFVDPRELSLSEWEARLAPGFCFDYAENDLHVTVEVVSVKRDAMVELLLRVVDDTYSRPTPPRRGDTFRASYASESGPFYVWMPRAEGHFARYAAWRRAAGERDDA